MRIALRAGLCVVGAAAVYAASPTQEQRRQRHIALTDSWTRAVRFTRAETEAMEAGRPREPLMMRGLDDPLAKKVLADGEPSFDALTALYPGKILDRTVLGTWSDPRDTHAFPEEFVIWWNGAISADLRSIVFRVGPEAEMFGADRSRFSSIGYEDGYLPVVTATYDHGGVRYREVAFAAEPDLAFVQFEITNTTHAARTAALHVDAEGQERRSHRFHLAPDERAEVALKIPWHASRTIQEGTRAEFDAAHAKTRSFWEALLNAGARIEVPEDRVNRVWRALLLQNFILADGPRFTYGSGLRYNDSYYPQESGFGAHTFAMYGHGDYANGLLPYSVPVSVDRGRAARKYQNRRAMPLHHLLENWRFTRKTDVFERHRNDLYRVADEIVADRRTTMRRENGGRPLHWGLLPPDRPGVDERAATQTVYVLGHNITNAQGLHDFGQFLVDSGLDPARGRRYLDEARAFRRDLLTAMRRAAIRVPGRPPFVDLQTLYFRDTPEFGPEPYDDLALGRVQGTYFHYWADMTFQYNFFNPDDDVGQWIAEYVAERGGFVLGCTRARQRPDSPYGWINNVYNSGYYNYRLRSGRIEEFLLGFYSRLAFGMTRHTYVASEGSPFIGYNTRDGGPVSADYSFPNSAANAETLHMLRLALVMEELRDNAPTGDLYLLRGAPRRWFGDGTRVRVSDMPTYFGSVSFDVEFAAAQQRLSARIRPPAGDNWRQLVLSARHPARAPIRAVIVNGAPHTAFDAAGGEVRLPRGPREFVVRVEY